ncbi:unnamed protein product, partial [Mesorhabditis belari]|uniref:Uncharacterized protein n=1 Tax=Mesorhabditis belari TaxID=2138241 RepID=A0AAF3F0T0_9BILA
MYFSKISLHFQEPSTLSPTDFPTPDILTTETGETTVDSGEIHSTMMLTPDETPEPITRITPVEQTASSTETFTHTVETSTFSTTSFEQTTEFIHTIQPDSTPISIDPITATSMETLATSGVPMVTLTDDFPKPPTPAWQTGRWSSSTITSPVSITFSTVSETFETTSLSEQDQAIQHACGQKDEV